jgi:hypothetical protein
LFYKRFIDDGLVIVKDRPTADIVLRILNSSGLGFTSSVSDTSGIFLDLELFKPLGMQFSNRVAFRTYRKAMNRYLYIPAFSAHHPANIRSWIYGEILRLRNTTLLWNDFESQFWHFIRLLFKRGYSRRIIMQALSLVPETLVSPMLRQLPHHPLCDLADDSGSISVDSPPHVFRAPYVPGHSIPYGEIIRDGLDELTVSFSVGSRGAGLANPNPTAPRTITIANTHPKSLMERLSTLSKF